MKSPDSVQGHVPQPVYDLLKDWHGSLTKGPVPIFKSTQTLTLAKSTVSGTDGSITINANGAVVEIVAPT